MNITPVQENAKIVEEHRPYLGMSQLGHECKRYLWYYFRWAYAPEYTQRQLRIFSRGHREEPFVIADLIKWGYTVTGTQHEFIGPFGHVKGHCDGFILGFTGDDVALLEIKTMNAKAYALLLKHGLKDSKPGYYAQIQLYMHYGNVRHAIVIAVNKDTEERLYIHIPFNKQHAEMLIEKAETVLLEELPFPKIGGPSWFACKFCAAYEICHYGKEWVKSCRTCIFAEVHTDGEWYCVKHDKVLSLKEQRDACDFFERLPDGSSNSSK